MATLTVRNLDEATDRALRLAAAELGISKEEYVRRSLRQVVAQGERQGPPQAKTGAQLVARLKEIAAQAKHFDGLLDHLPARDSVIREVNLADTDQP